MPAHLDHTIVMAVDKHAAAEFLATILGLNVAAPYGPFLPVETGNGVTLDLMDSGGQAITRSTMRSWSPKPSSTRSSTGSARPRSPTTPTPGTPMPDRSTKTTAAEACTSPIRTDAASIITRPYGSNG